MSATFGRFLEISVHAPAIRESLAFYESLGFAQARVGEAWPYAYAVVTDGRLFLGLHAEPIASPSLTFVLPGVVRSLAAFEDRGIELDELHLGDEDFHRVTLRAPCGLSVNVLEARTFSPPQLEAPVATTCGYFAELGVPLRELSSAREFWEAAGFVALEEQLLPFARTALTGDHLNLALYRTRAFRSPLLTFEDRDMRERLTRLRERGIAVTDEMPDSLEETTNGVLIAPEGTRLLLLQSED